VYGWRWDRDKHNPDGTVGGWADIDELPDPKILVLDYGPAAFEILCDDEHEHLIVVGSRGSGKSFTGAGWKLKRIAVSPKQALSLLVAKRKKARRFVEKKLLPLMPHWWLTGSGRGSSVQGYRRAQDEISLSFKHGGMVDCLSAKVADDARGDDQTGALIEEAQLCPPEARENLILSGRRSEGADGNVLPIQTMETATLLAGEFEDYLAKARQDPSYRVWELSITDNIYLERKYDDVTGCMLPALVLWAREHMPQARFEQEIGVWDEDTQRFRPKAFRAEGLVYYGYQADRNLCAFDPRPRVAKKTIARIVSSIHPDVGADITSRDHSALWLCGMAFDANPYAAVVCKLFSAQDGHPPVLWAVDELESTDNDVVALAKQIKGAFGGEVLIVPDAAGRYSEGGRSSVDLLADMGFRVAGPRRNAYERDRHNAVNTKFFDGAGRTSLVISPKCKRLLRALHGQTLGDNGKEQVMDGGVDHFAAALGHLVVHFWPAAGAPGLRFAYA